MPERSAYILPPRFGSLSTFNMRIRIQSGKFWEKKMKKCKEISNNSSFIQKSKYWSIFLVFINTVYRFFYKFCKAVSGSGSPLRKLLDPDLLKLNADPQPSLLSSSYFIWPVLHLWGVLFQILKQFTGTELQSVASSEIVSGILWLNTGVGTSKAYFIS